VTEDNVPMILSKMSTLEKENMVLKNNLKNFKGLVGIGKGNSGNFNLKKMEMEVESDLVSMIHCAFSYVENSLKE